MLKKKNLLSARFQKSIKSIPEGTDMKKIYWGVSAKAVKSGSDKLLVVAFYPLENMQLAFTVFSDGKGFITYNEKTQKWTETMTFKLLGEYYYYSAELESACVYLNAESINCASSFFGVTKPTVSALCDFEQNLRDKACERCKAIRQSKTDAVMDKVKLLPKSFDQWVNDVPFGFSRYIYYKRHGKVINGYCTACRCDVTLKLAKHNETGVCPHCGKKVTFKAEGHARRIYDWTDYAILQHVNGGFMLRCFWASKSYMNHYRKPIFDGGERFRYFFPESGKVRMFEQMYLYCGQNDWKQFWREDKKISQKRDCFLYTRNLNAILKKSLWQYSRIYNFAKRAGSFNTFGYLDSFPDRPCVEVFEKMGLDALLRATISRNYGKGNEYVDFCGKTFKNVFKFNLQDIPFIVKMNMNLSEIRLYETAREHGGLSEKEIVWLRDADSNADYYGFSYDHFCEIFDFTTPHRAIKYLKRQYELCSENCGYGTLVILWADYLNNSEWLRRNMKSNSVMFPKDLRKSHDRVSTLREEKEKNELYSQVAKFEAGTNEMYYFETKSLLIRAPHDAGEIVAEGDKLEHCVANYIERVANGETTILFIREKEEPSNPYVTVEVKDGTVRQVYGFHDSIPKADVKRFVERFKANRLSSGEGKKAA